MALHPQLPVLKKLLSLISGTLRRMKSENVVFQVTPEIQDLVDRGLVRFAHKAFDPKDIVPVPWTGEGTASEAFERFRDGRE